MERLERNGSKGEKKSIGEVVKTIPHLIASTILAPIAVPYACAAIFYRSNFISPVDGYSADCVNDFIENDKLTNFWENGFTKFGRAIKGDKRGA